MNGAELYRLVEQYHTLGIHRAGTAVDHRTVDWYADELGRRGITAEREAVPFERYVTDSELTADGEPIDHLPFFYEWVGEIDTTDVAVTMVDAGYGGYDDQLDAAVAGAGASGHAAHVFATDHPDGALVAVNRAPHLHGGRPTVLVAGRDHARVAAASEVHLRMRARIEPGETINLVGRNDVVGAPVLVTTPLTGWFGCAGERGTGAVVMLDLIERFADTPLLVLATGGHELDYLGVRRWVEAGGADVRGIVHVGASVAVDAPTDDGARALVGTRIVRTDLDGDDASRIGDAVTQAGFAYLPATPDWSGESEVLCALDCPMLSMTGMGIDFHTPDDTPARATSAPSLAIVADAIADAVAAFADATAG